MMKVIAALCMLIDHIGLIFYPLDLRWRIIGRLAMPIFAYGVARGAFYTSSIKRYMKKMLLFSVASQIPFWGMRYLDGGQAFFTLNLNIGFTFWIALWCIAYLQKIGYKPQLEEKEEMLEVARQSTVETNKKVCTIVVVLASILLADVLGCDYSSYGVLVVIMGYFMFLL